MEKVILAADRRAVYFSNFPPPEYWRKAESYYFPYAYKVCRWKYGWTILKAYVWIRMKIEDIWRKK